MRALTASNWARISRPAWPTGSQLSRAADRCNRYGVAYSAAATLLFFVGLIANIFIYVSFVTSPSQDNADALAQWKRVGIPVIGINYLMLMLAILFMFVGNVYQSLYKDPS